MAAILFVLAGSSVCAAASRSHQRMDADWRFWLDASVQSSQNDIPEWRWRPLPNGVDTNAPTLESLAGQPSPTDFKTAHPGEDVFHGRRGFCLFEASVTVRVRGKGTTSLHFASVDDNATVYLNGKRVLHHEGWDDPFDVPLPGLRGGDPITVDVLVENTDGPGGIGDTAFVTSLTDNAPKQAAPGFDDSRWRTVHLPHDFVVEGKFAPDSDPGHGSLPRGVAWYRKSFVLPSSARGRSVWIDFDGAFSDAHLWLNGRFLGSHRSGYSGFRFDLSKKANFGSENVLAVRLDARKTEGWWYEGGGLYRHVWLTIADPVHIAPLGGVYVTTDVPSPLSADPQATIHVTTKVENSSGLAQPCLVRETVIRPDGSTVSRSDALGFKGRFSILEPHARLWSVEKPQLYTLRTSVFVGTRKVDEIYTPFGIRTARWDRDRGFLLNGRVVKLKGTCNHQDFAGVGIGMPDSVLTWRIQKLKQMGSNAYRCSHNEVASELLDACDRLGMLVMDENREFGDTFSGKANERTTTNDLSDLRQEVLRDRNHPSVIMWSIANEEFSVQTTPAGGRIGSALTALVHELDPSRPVTAALNGGHASYFSKTLDLEGFNYGPDGYAPYHRDHPFKPMFASETASTVTSRGEYADDKVHGYVTAYDKEGANTAEDAWEPIAREPYNGGGFVWTGFDYKGEPSPYGWPCVNSHFGIMDLCGFPKDNYYYYKAWWGDQPIVHIEPHWNWPGKEGRPIEVWAFSNADSVELFLNGRSLGQKPMPRYRHLEWSVPYEPGALVAKGLVNGKLVATDRVSTTGGPAALRVSTTRRGLTADGEDCAMLEVSVVDAQGRTVPTASNLVKFAVNGPARIAGVGNGDPSCHEPDRASERHAFHGLCLGIVQARNHGGKAIVTISSPGLRSAKVSLNVREARNRD